jgi:hypothetical protein
MARASDRAHRLAQKQLDALAGRSLTSLLASLDAEPGNQTAMDTYNLASLRVVGGLQRRSAQLAFAYVRTISAPTRPPSLNRALEGVAVDDQSPVTRSPVLRLWREVGQGIERAAAVQTASAYAATLASNDLAVAERGGLAEAGDAADMPIRGWRKELAANACEWCILVGAERIYNEADTVPFHANDECSVAPVFVGEDFP